MGNFDQLLEEFDLLHKKKEISQAMKSAIGIRAMQESEENIPIGTSKLGGLPDLPPHFEFPKYHHGYLSFLGQINLSEAKPFDVDHILPDQGILYFFYDIIEQPWGFEKEDNGSFKVLYFKGDLSELTRTDYPEPIDDYSPLKAFKVKFYQHQTVSEDPEGLELNEEESENFLEFRSQAMQPSKDDHLLPAHYMLGEPLNIQNDVFEEMVYYSNENKYGTNGWQSNHREIRARSKELVLLFQMDSDDDLDVMWGDAGILYFCIHKDDLKNKRFEKVGFILQCY
ncbi:hypothetical protein BACCIP111895_04520 [Neobacillus rhizosphaerae]|uniref:Cytoplasmic protein n=1 Tax=Neobacillus rhizosphaerae TaxID=2880965 RepID=A0ABM9EX97_9BACI|nr:YwqG family protein [Neobacillus rhizosphaerae]CAH2717328.1 hypothetical protein BACCIP111895_04520 [Neobacillus rhizosphaerae]